MDPFKELAVAYADAMREHFRAMRELDDAQNYLNATQKVYAKAHEDLIAEAKK